MLPTLHQAAKLIEQRTGLSIRRRSDIEEILSQLSGGDVTALVKHLRGSPLESRVWQGVIQALAIGETYFFRDPRHFELLRTHILPTLIRKRRAERQYTLNLWSVGCATGEEPYSLAILLHELLPDLDRWTINLIGTDINATALEAARHGVYRLWSFRQGDLHHSRYFDEVEEGWRLKPEIREMVTFQQGQLLTGATRTYDVIFCRNVLLYFTPEQAVAAEAVLREALVPGGWLFLGHSEGLHGDKSGWVMHQFPGIPIYQKEVEDALLSVHSLPTTPSLNNTNRDYERAKQAYYADQREAAMEMLERLVREQPDHARGWTLLACLAQDRQEAHRYLDSALVLEPLLADAHYLRALLHQETGEIEAARKALRAAIYAQRNHPLAAYTLATLYAEAGEFERAVKLWEQAQGVIALFPPQNPLCDVSEMTAARLQTLIEEQLAAWR